MPKTKRPETAAELKKRVAELGVALEKTSIRAEANEILVAIALEKYDIDLRKKTGPKRWKGCIFSLKRKVFTSGFSYLSSRRAV